MIFGDAMETNSKLAGYGMVDRKSPRIYPEFCLSLGIVINQPEVICNVSESMISPGWEDPVEYSSRSPGAHRHLCQWRDIRVVLYCQLPLQGPEIYSEPNLKGS